VHVDPEAVMDVLDETAVRSDQAEQELIGAVAFHPDTLAAVLAGLSGADFYNPARGIVWDACRELSAERKAVNPVTVSRHLAATERLRPLRRPERPPGRRLRP
jgi:replicative DNA helicase